MCTTLHRNLLQASNLHKIAGLEKEKPKKSEEREEERKREQGNDIPEKIAGEHKPYSRVAQVPVRLPRSREDQPAQARQRDDRPAWRT